MKIRLFSNICNRRNHCTTIIVAGRAYTYDAGGNQTRIRTATGIWNVTYNAENRPIRFESEDSASVIECTYDYMGRRHTRKVTVNGSISSYLRYIYRGYLQIAAIDAVNGVFRWFLFWDPTQPTATRPLAIRKDSTWYAYGWDLTKNVTEVFGKAGYLRTAYTYTPYGTATANGDVTQPLTWSSEYADEELALIYYNHRHYNPTDGRWINRDIGEIYGINLYAYVDSNPSLYMDYIGLKTCKKDVLLTHFGDLKSDKVGTRDNKLQPGDVAVGHYGKKQHPQKRDKWVLPFGTPVRVIYEDGTMFNGKVADVGAYDKIHADKAKPEDWIDVWNPEKSRKNISSLGCIQVEVKDECPCPATYIEGKCLKRKKRKKSKLKKRTRA